ncbi:MAG: ADP-forming succinate--CoA ligase subunit beta [Candidatus Gastranaerophilales bacterium]|nr:ADP-forming succinate--CoA ligase subunit beta [Candidatus Gastranaerophilales bacterium]
MKIHEYQAKELFKQYEIKVPNSVLCEKHEDIECVLNQVPIPCVIKAQVHSGARGKAGGVKVAKDFDSAIEVANNILGMELKSSQAGIKKVNKILIEECVDIEKELYLSLTFDRTNECIALILSTEGGMDIENVAKATPEKIHTLQIKEYLNPKELVQKLGFNNEINKKIEKIINSLYKLMIEKDATLVEINPLVITKQGDVIALDAKINFDDNALFRHEDILLLKDETEENPLELEAQKSSLSYIKLDGTIGCMVNGAGLAMATMDVIKLAGKDAANFLDVGGGASSEKIEKAFRLLISDENLEAVFINIFGGILRCDFLAEGVKNAIKTLNVQVPVIVRMEGTNKELGTEILNNSGLKFTVVNDLNEAIEVIRKI